MDPYQVLGISPSASDDEVKQAYRTLSKKYHPDANINNVHKDEYTEKFKQVQSAYKTIMDNRKRGFTNQTYGNYTNDQGHQYSNNEQASLNEAAAYINAGRFQDAIHILDQIKNKTSVWFYYSAIAHNGIGNNITALDYAKAAVSMEPGNLQYLLLLQQLQGSQGAYRTGQQNYGSPYASMVNCCYTMLLLNIITTCCCRCY